MRCWHMKCASSLERRERFLKEQDEGNMGWGDDITTPQNMRGYRLAVFTQLRQAIEAIHSPEEMFRWLSSMIMQSFDVPIVQIWTCENGWTGQPSARLRAMASQN